MKKNYVTILVLAMAAAILLTAALPCGAAEEKKGTSEGEHGRRYRRFELTDEAADRIMNRLKETNPEKAAELEKLRTENPEQFKVELKKAMRERFGRRHKEGIERGGRGERGEHWGGREHRREADKPLMRRSKRGAGTKGADRPGKVKGRGGRDEPGRRGGRGMMWERHEEFLKWLKENYPEEAEKLAGLRTKKPKDYDRRFGHSLRKFRRIYEAEKENPKLAGVLKEDLKLKQERGKLLDKIKATKDDDEKKELTGQLNEVVGKRFDLIVKRKQIEYERLLEKLEKLKKEVKESEAEVDKWNDAKFKKENVKTRVDDLVSGKEKFRWDK